MALRLCLLALLLGAAACKDGTLAPSKDDPNRPPSIVGAWTHSYEEDPEGGAEWWYRPTDSRDFTPSLFRMRYEFRADGTCDYLWLSPIDAHEMRPGTWDFDASRDLVNVYDEDGELLDFQSFGLIDVEDDLLRALPPHVR